MKRIYVLVSNDLTTDQRVHKICTTLMDEGMQPVLIGRLRSFSKPIHDRKYEIRRLRLFFEKGPLFYLALNLRFLLYLLFKRVDGLYINDLDVLPAGYLLKGLKGCKLIYDSHELFTEVPELRRAPVKRRTWEILESLIVPKLGSMITVNNSIADIFQARYHVKVDVVRNVPYRQSYESIEAAAIPGLPTGRKVVIMQGAGINIERGAEEAVQAFKYIDDALLVIIGSGDVFDSLKILVHQLKLNDKVYLYPRVPFDVLIGYTKSCHLGLSLDKPLSLNYKLSLPNKLFDYIHAGVPVVASDLPEVRKVIDDYNVGQIVSSHEPEKIAEAINSALSNSERYHQWKANCLKASDSLCWEIESEILRKRIREGFN